MRKLTCPPNVELLGLYIDAFVSNIQGAETRPIMEKYGLANLDPHGWYPCHKWMDALNELAQLPETIARELGTWIAVTRGEGRWEHEGRSYRSIPPLLPRAQTGSRPMDHRWSRQPPADQQR